MTDFEAGTVPFAFHGARLRFQLARTLFSSSGIDAGSRLLLRHLQAAPPPCGGRVLDVGCGHGVLGIVLAALDPERSVTFVDRDALACRMTVENLAGNGLASDRQQVVGSLGYDDVDHGPYDLIVSNVPGKAGDEPIAELVTGAVARTAPGGLVGLVVVSALADDVDAVLGSVPGLEPVRLGNRAHTVFLVRPDQARSRPAPPTDGAFPRGIYDRATATFSAGRSSWTATTVTGLPEFDSLSYATRLLPRVLRDLPAQRAAVMAPGQGHRALLVALAGHDLRALVDRDLLALRASDRLLAGAGRGGADLVHAATVPDDVLADTRLLAVHAGDKVHLPWLRAELERHLDRRGRRSLVLTGRAPMLGRLEAELLRRRPGRVLAVRSERGHRALSYQQG